MKNLNPLVARHIDRWSCQSAVSLVVAKNLFSTLIRVAGATLAAATLITVSAHAATYDFLSLKVIGAGGKFTSPNGNGFITVTNTGGPFLGLNNTEYPSKFTNLFASSGQVTGWLAQADSSATYTNTFYLANYALAPQTIFGIWNITEGYEGTYDIKVYDSANNLISPPFYWNFYGYDDNALDGNIGWYHMYLNPGSGVLITTNFKASGIDCDAAFWDNITNKADRIVVTGRLGPGGADGVVFYFAEPHSCVGCVTNLVDCQCLNHLPALQTNGCPGVIPDLCQFSQCWLAPTPLQCSQSPAAGGQVGQGTYPITVTFTDPFANQTQVCVVNFVVTGCGTNCVPPPPGMVGWWPLDELCGATVFADSSGGGNAALVESGGPLCNPGRPSATLGKVAGASFFTGPTVRGRAPNNASLNFGTGSFSVDCWVKPVPFGGGRQPIVDKLDLPGGNSAFGYALSVLNGNLELRLGDGSLFTHTGPAVNFNAWNFVGVAVDRSSSKVNFYVNGTPAAPQTLAPAGSFNSSVDLLIGGSHTPNDPYGELAIDELELFNRVVTNAEFNALWNADSSGKCKTNAPCANSIVSIFCPPDTNAETCATSAIVVYPPPVASTSCGTITNLVCTPASGSSFPLGTTTVTCTATDSQGNSKSCTFKVTATTDHTPPSCPPSSLSITGCPPLVPDFASNGLITDNCTPVGQISVVQNPTPGTVLPPGQSVATLTTCDTNNNCAQCVVTLTAIYAGPPPTITCPPNIVVTGYQLCDANGRQVIYPPPVVSNGTLVSSTPPSGSLFPFGTTTVTCVATNACATNQCTFTVTVNWGGTEPPCAPPPTNLVLWLSFDESSGLTAFNSSAGNHGTLVNAPTRNPNAYVKGSLCFNGVNQFVQVKPYPAVQFGTGDFSVDAWVKPNTLDSTVRVIVDHREENGGVVRGYSLFLGGNNLLAFQIADGTFINYPSALTVPADGQWHLVAVTVKRNDPQGIRFYVDGVQDSVPRNPTGHQGSVTAGPCYPLRVGSRSSSVSGVFDGCIDEVELFRRALKASEIQTIYDVRCKGKCHIACQQMKIELIPGCNAPIQAYGVIYNPSPLPQTFNFSFQNLPVGPGCDVTGLTFTPATGTVTVGPYQSTLVPPFPNPVIISHPPGLTNGLCACFQMVLTSTDGSQQLVCAGKICVGKIKAPFCAEVSPPLALLTNLEPREVSFILSGTGPALTVLTNPVIAFLSPEQEVISVTPLPNILIPAAGGGSVVVPHSIAFPEYDPGRKYSLQLEADMDGDGQYEPVASLPAVNIIPSTESGLTISRSPAGEVIITWPNPCAILEMNPNLSNPAGWTMAPVQTSPWRSRQTNGPAYFFRLRE